MGRERYYDEDNARRAQQYKEDDEKAATLKVSLNEAVFAASTVLLETLRRHFGNNNKSPHPLPVEVMAAIDDLILARINQALGKICSSSTTRGPDDFALTTRPASPLD